MVERPVARPLLQRLQLGWAVNVAPAVRDECVAIVEGEGPRHASQLRVFVTRIAEPSSRTDVMARRLCHQVALQRHGVIVDGCERNRAKVGLCARNGKRGLTAAEQSADGGRPKMLVLHVSNAANESDEVAADGVGRCRAKEEEEEACDGGDVAAGAQKVEVPARGKQDELHEDMSKQGEAGED